MTKPEYFQIRNTLVLMAHVVRDLPLDEFVKSIDLSQPLSQCPTAAERLDLIQMRDLASKLASFKGAAQSAKI